MTVTLASCFAFSLHYTHRLHIIYDVMSKNRRYHIYSVVNKYVQVCNSIDLHTAHLYTQSVETMSTFQRMRRSDFTTGQMYMELYVHFE